MAVFPVIRGKVSKLLEDKTEKIKRDILIFHPEILLDHTD